MHNFKKFGQHVKKHYRIYGFLVGVIFVIAGSAIVVPSIYYSKQASATAELPASLEALPIPDKPEVLSGNPVRLIVPSAEIDINIVDGQYDESSASWSVSLDNAHFANVTTKPNNFSGNTYIYGHNRSNVFARLVNMSKEDIAIVQTDNGLSFYYTLDEISETNPQDVESMLAYTDGPSLTLQTCSGAWYQNRQLFRFSFDKVVEQLD